MRSSPRGPGAGASAAERALQGVAKRFVEDVVEAGVAAAARFAEQRVDEAAGQLAEHGVAGPRGDCDVDDGGEEIADSAEEAHGVTPVCNAGGIGGIALGVRVRAPRVSKLPAPAPSWGVPHLGQTLASTVE